MVTCVYIYIYGCLTASKLKFFNVFLYVMKRYCGFFRNPAPPWMVECLLKNMKNHLSTGRMSSIVPIITPSHVMVPAWHIAAVHQGVVGHEGMSHLGCHHWVAAAAQLDLV